MFDKKMIKNLDWVFLILLALLVTVSMVVLASASANVSLYGSTYYVKRQLMFLGVGLVAMVGAALFNYRDLSHYVPLAYIGLLVLLVGVFFAPHGQNALTEANRSYYIGGYMFQPSELGKLIVIVTLAKFLSQRQERIAEWSTFFWVFAIMAVPMVLILLEPDLGSTLVFGFTMLVMMWLSGIPRRRVLILLLVIALLVGLVFLDLWFATDGFEHMIEELPVPLPMHTYQLNRLIIFINPQMDPRDEGYQLIQSVVAIGSGGLLGKGYGEGSQVQSDFVPFHHTDFVFSVVGEELGFVGSVGVLLLFLLLLLRIMRIANQSADLFGSLIVSGIVAMLFFQIFVNIGMTMGIMPITGITLPFFSYGGTSLLINLMAMGLVLSVNMRREIKIF